MVRPNSGKATVAWDPSTPFSSGWFEQGKHSALRQPARGAHLTDVRRQVGRAYLPCITRNLRGSMTSFQTLIINVVLRPLVPLIAESLKARTLRDLAQAYNHTGLASTRGLQVEIEHQIRKFKEREERGE